jgi:hypothetical protein
MRALLIFLLTKLLFLIILLIKKGDEHMKKSWIDKFPKEKPKNVYSIKTNTLKGKQLTRYLIEMDEMPKQTVYNKTTR